MVNNKIELTSQELEDIKDDVKFKTMVAIRLKELCDLPKRVEGLAFQSKFQWLLISGIILSFIGVALRVIAR